MLELDHLELQQGSFHLAVNWSLETGARLALIGPSGGGKSTLLSAIAGFLPPISGKVRLDGADLSPLPPGNRPTSLLFQSHNLFPHLTCAQNVGLGLSPKRHFTETEKQKIETALERAGLKGLGSRKPAELSGGQQQRVALARILLMNRPVLLLDEPFAALGPGLRADMLDLVAEMLRDRTMTLLMVTHDPGDAARIADQISFVDDGIAHPPVDKDRLLAHPPPELQAYLGTARPLLG